MGLPRAEVLADWLQGETPEDKRRRAAKVYRRLEKSYPDAECALNFSNPFEMLVSTVLSAQCTDVKVNEVTASLFRKYRKPEDYLASKPGELEDDIRPTGFYNQKSKSLRGISRVLLEEHGGQVPRTMDELLRLPGVARKTANVVLGNSFGVVEGIAVDTHVHRISYRLGFAGPKDPADAERELMALFPKSRWFRLTYLLIEHGRAVCKAPNPLCADCVVSDSCPASRLPGSSSPAKSSPAARARKPGRTA